MSIRAYRRHRQGCPKANDRFAKHDKCSIWVEGTLEGKYKRYSLKTNVWDRANDLVRELERGKKAEEESITIGHATQKFIEDCEARAITHSTVRKYRTLKSLLCGWFEANGFPNLVDITPDAIRSFRATRKLAPSTTVKELARIRAIFNFCVSNGWLTKSPAKPVKAPQPKDKPTLPFKDSEVAKLLGHTVFRAQVFFRLLLHSGLRIIDAAQMRPERIENDKLFLYQQKTGVGVRVPLPPDLIADLEKLPLTGGFYFVVKSENPVSIAEYYRVKLKKAGKLAGVANAHPHRFRDTLPADFLRKACRSKRFQSSWGIPTLRPRKKATRRG